MRHFYRKAKIKESLGRFCDFRIVDKAIETAARIAREIVSFRHPRISAIKLAVADPNADLLRGDMTADEMREIIRGKLIEEGSVAELIQGLLEQTPVVIIRGRPSKKGHARAKSEIIRRAEDLQGGFACVA